MEIVLTITKSAALPEKLLRAFVSKAEASGQTPDERLAKLLSDDVATESHAKPRKRKEAKA